MLKKFKWSLHNVVYSIDRTLLHLLQPDSVKVVSFLFALHTFIHFSNLFMALTTNLKLCCELSIFSLFKAILWHKIVTFKLIMSRFNQKRFVGQLNGPDLGNDALKLAGIHYFRHVRRGCIHICSPAASFFPPLQPCRWAKREGRWIIYPITRQAATRKNVCKCSSC